MAIAKYENQHQWKATSILPILKSSIPLQHFDYKPNSITPVLSRFLERIVVKDFIYPSLRTPLPGFSFHDQFDFQPTDSPAAVFIQLLHTITSFLATHPHVIVYALDFSKAFDSVHPREDLNTFSRMNLPDNVYNWIENLFRDHSHCLHVQTNSCKHNSRIWYRTRFLHCDSIGPASD